MTMATVYNRRQKCRLILIVKKFQVISNLTISAALHGLLTPEESLNWKNQFPCFKNTLYRHYYTQPAYIICKNISKFYKRTAKITL